MKPPPSIPAEPPAEVAADFARLQKEAHQRLRDWCTGNDGWTDFNLADPGVQIVEELCYALTDLWHRCGLPLGTLLQNRPGRIDWENGAFFSPPQIFPMGPLTAADYRKLLLDRFEELYQVWVTTAAGGRLKVWLYPEPNARLSRLPQRCAAFLAQLRNVGESFEVRLAPAVRFTLEATLELAAGQEPQAALAAMAQAIQQSVTARPAFRSIAERRAGGESLAEIFTGPPLEHGTIAEESLASPCTWAEAEVLATNALTGLPGIAVKQVKFTRCDGARPAAELTEIPPAFVFSQCFHAGAKCANRIEFTGETGAAIDAAQVRFLRRHLGPGRAPLCTATLRPGGWSMPAADPQWSAGTVRIYHSVQAGFPRNYQLGAEELPPSASPLRRAQVKQLRAYLAHFDQLMANLLAQLGHVASLFSSEPQQQTYFSQPIYSAPGVFPLLRGFNDDNLPPGGKGAAARRDAFRANTGNPYQSGLRQLNETPVEFVRRRHAFLDHLLARFGESYPAVRGGMFERPTNKEAVLRALPELGVRRAAGAAGAGTDSGLEEKVRRLLEPEVPVRAGRFAHRRSYFLIDPALATPTDWAAPAAEAFQLTHVLVNWTDTPFNPALKAEVQAVILENTGAHFVNRFVWLDAARGPLKPAGRPRLAGFLRLRRGWLRGQPGAAEKLVAWAGAQRAPARAAS